VSKLLIQRQSRNNNLAHDVGGQSLMSVFLFFGVVGPMENGFRC